MKVAGFECEILSNTSAKVGCATVTMTEAAALIEEMKNYVSPPKFAIGDYVKVIVVTGSEASKNLAGKFGKVVALVAPHDYKYTVEFAEKIGHDMNVASKPGHFWWFRDEHLEKVP